MPAMLDKWRYVARGEDAHHMRQHIAVTLHPQPEQPARAIH